MASNGVTVVNSQNHTTAGVQSVELPSRGSISGATRNMRADIGAYGVTQAWITLHIQWRQQGEPEDGDTAVAGDIYMHDDRLLAYDGALQNWTISEKSFSVGSDIWTRIDLGMDYANRKYLVCMDGVLAVDAVSFGDSNITSLAQLEILGSPAETDFNSYVDDIRISSEEPAADLDFDDDGLSNAEEYQVGSNRGYQQNHARMTKNCDLPARTGYYSISCRGCCSGKG